MRRLLFLIAALTSTSFSGTQKQPANCATRPCIYVITCASQTCDGSEVQEVQDALDDAQRGDTIKLQAGRIFPIGSDMLKISRRSGSSGYLTLTTTEDESLPPREMTRITPHWLSKMPVLRATGNLRALFLHCTPSADNIRIRGIVFDGQDKSGQLLTIGCLAWGTATPAFGRKASSNTDQPDNIIVEHCIFRNRDWKLREALAHLAVNTRGARIRNNWIAGGRAQGAETQAILLWNGPGPIDILNNYLADTGGETIMHGGTGPDWEVSPSGSMMLNSFYNHPERLLGTRPNNPQWGARMVVFAGRTLKAGSFWQQAQTGGTTGTSAPTWCTTLNCTTNDNGVVWKAVVSNNAASEIVLKNLYESKNSQEVVNAWNQYRGYTNHAQAQAVVYKLSNYPPANGVKGQCVPYMTGRVNTNGLVVTSADGKRIPNNHLPIQTGNVDPYQIKINGSNYTIGDFVWDDDYTLRLTTSAGVQSNITYTYGDPSSGGCMVLGNRDNKFIHNIIEQSSMAFEHIQPTNGMMWRIGNLLVRNNLFREIDCNVWGGCTGGLSVRSFAWFMWAVNGQMFEHNTIIDSQNAPQSAMLFSNPNVVGKGLRRFRGNIWPKSGGVGFLGIDPVQGEGDSSMKVHLCKSSDCTANEWGANIVAGADKSKYTKGGPTYNLCSGTGPCNVNFDYDDPTYGKLYQNYSVGLLKPRQSHYSFHGGPEGDSIGADYQMLPLIRKIGGGEGPSITTTNSAALFSYWVHTPLVAYDLACSLEVSTTQDMDNLISVTDPNRLTDINDLYPRTGNRRNIVVSGLSSGTQYWYRLHCGPVYEGSFTTPGSSGSAKSVTVDFKAAETTQFRIAYGSSYSRSSDEIQSASFGGWVSCTTAQACKVSVTVPAGIAYYRVESQTGNKRPVEVRPI